MVDLGRPERFWHMMIQSETFRPMFKWWSPMSAGSWGLSAFGAFSFGDDILPPAQDIAERFPKEAGGRSLPGSFKPTVGGTGIEPATTGM